VSSLQLSIPLAQSSSYVTAPDQSKVVLQIRAMCRATSSILQKKHGCFLGDWAILDVIFFHLNFLQ